MRPSEGSIGKSKYRDDHKEYEDTHKACVDIAVPVNWVIPEKKKNKKKK